MAKADDSITIAAIAIIAACGATAAHEAAGHGGACLLLGGAITQLTSVYFQCSAHDTWIAAAGPLGNLIAAALAWLALQATPRSAPHARLLLFMTAMISLFWFAGYLLYSALLNEGDLYFVARDFVGEPSLVLRLASGVTAIALYWAGLRAMRSVTRGAAEDRLIWRQRLRVSWLAASLSACLAALAYSADRFAAVGQAALEIGAACLPMLARSAMEPAEAGVRDAEITRSWGWIGAALVIFGVFAATLGHGLP